MIPMIGQMNKVRVSTGRLVNPFDLQIEDMCPQEFLHSISMLNRFTGQCRHPYSVGQHTLNLCAVVPLRLRRAAMIHDWSETFFNDLASPVKAALPDYKAAEANCGMRIAGLMEVPWEDLHDLKEYDQRIYVNERDAMFPEVNELGRGDDLVALPNTREHMFLEKNWRDVRQRLHMEFRNLFPEWRGQSLRHHYLNPMGAY